MFVLLLEALVFCFCATCLSPQLCIVSRLTLHLRSSRKTGILWRKSGWLSFAVVALLFVLRFVLVVVCWLLIAVATPAADMKVPDKPQPFVNLDSGASGCCCDGCCTELIWCVWFCKGECMQAEVEFVYLVLHLHACLHSAPCLVGSLELVCVCPVGVWFREFTLRDHLGY